MTDANQQKLEATKAPLACQLGSEPCAVEDTGEMFWLRMADDYQSKFALGNALAAQYRFKEAIEIYEEAMRIKSDDWHLYYSLGGAYLTLRHFDQGMAAYRRCLELGASEKTVSYPMGVGHYLMGHYEGAAARFAMVLPCDGEMEIAIIYWHTLCCYRTGSEPSLLNRFHKDLDVGHHIAYRSAVSVFSGELPWEQAARETLDDDDDVNAVVSLYGLCGYLDRIGLHGDSAYYRSKLLARDHVWPCIPYLAAWGDRLNPTIFASPLGEKY